MELSKPQKLIYSMENFIGGAASIVCGSMLVQTDKSVEEMINAAKELYRLNDILRLRISVKDGQVYQYIKEYEEPDVEALFFDSKEELDEYASKYTKEPFDIHGHLFEIKIIILPHKRGILPKFHHIISDAWTIALIGTQFNRVLNGEEVQAYSYFDYIKSEEKYLASKRYIKDNDYFISQFNKCGDLVRLSENQVKTFNSERLTFTFDNKIVCEINSYIKKNQVSAFTLFLSVFSAYMNRVKMNAEKFYIGTSILNRSGAKEQNTMGMFVNTVPILIELNTEESFSDNLKAVDANALSVLRHQKYNYGDLLEEIRKKYGYKEKLFDVILSYQNATIFGEDVETTWYHTGMQSESLQIHIDDRDNKGEFKIHYDYQVEKFTKKDIEEFHERFCNILFDALEHPEKKITELEMLSNEEKDKLLYEFNATSHSYDVPDNSTLFSLFEKTAEENKEKVCIKTAEGKLTFGELRSASENLDARLREITGNKKSVVAVIAERSPEMYAAIYGIIRGGNAYLPIDPKYPQDRIEYILKNSNAAAVVVQKKLIHLAGDVPVIDMTAFLDSGCKENNIPVCTAEPDDTAYVIYTSGSTGNPKGARISHKSAINRILWMHDKYPLGVNDVILQKTPYTFDVSVWELFWWAICGGGLAASKPDEHFLPAKIIDEVYNNKVTHLHFVPSVFELFLSFLESNEAERSKFETVKYVFLSGEALSASLVQRFYDMYDCNKVTLHNLYGPTECAVDVTYYDCMPADIDPVPIGKPIYNTQMYVVDKYNNPVPVGVTGELCIAGVNVGQGYLNNPELTAEKFIDNPFGEGKLYKTGDLAYWREDGNIVFIGRIDHQIKLGGQRIEIGEIESVISEVNGIESVAVVINKTAGREMLVAFFTGKDDNNTMKEMCLSKLPRYMVPGAFVHLEKLPLNQSGKLDRKALSSKTIEFAQFDEGEAPINDTERFICELFGKTLGKEGVGRHSDFFELGGTSLSMISLISEKEFENISAADFVRNSTPYKLSLLMNDKNEERYEYLEALYVNKDADKVMILLPFAGGGAEAYSRLVNSIKERNSDRSLYFIRYLHSTEECRKAASEIAEAFSGKQINFYSHCVGSAIALQIIRELEACGVNVKNYFAGASIPPAKPTRWNVWNSVPDKVLTTILSKAGAQLSNLPQEILTEMLKSFRKDTDFAGVSYCEAEAKIKAPVTVILSKKDIFTKNYRQTEKCWSLYAENIKGIRFIDSKSHYFQSDDAEALINQLDF